MSEPSPARTAALALLAEARERDAYVRELAHAAPALRGLDQRDRALAVRMALGATAAAGTLDELIDRFMDKPRKVSARVRLALRLAAFDLLYLGTPDAAAVSQGVELVRMQASRAAGLANAVLRRAAGEKDAFLAALDVPPAHRALAVAARGAGLPYWLVGQVRDAAPAACDALCACALEPAPVYVQANPYRLDDGAFCAAAASEGLGAQPAELPGCYRVKASSLAGSDLMARADAAVSDLVAQMVAAAATRPGSLLEVGAGRGTKTYVIEALAARSGAGDGREHVAVDLHASKARLNAERLRAAGMPLVSCAAADGRRLRSVAAELPDGTALAERCAAGFDTVLLDAPCSGTGTMRRHPEIPWRLRKADVDPRKAGSLPALQADLLAEAASCVRPGGELLYATCSVLPAENEGAVRAFLAGPAGKGFRVEPVSEAWAFMRAGFADARAWARAHETPEGYLRTVPVSGGPDGHFCARLVRA